MRVTTGLGWAGSRPQGQLNKKPLSPHGAAPAGAPCHAPWGREWAQHCRPQRLSSPRTGPRAWVPTSAAPTAVGAEAWRFPSSERPVFRKEVWVGKGT